MKQKIIPKRTKFRLKFRNKTETKKLLKHERRLKTSPHLRLLNMDSWLPGFPIGTLARNNVFVSHDYTENLLFGTFGIALLGHGNLTAKLISTLHVDIKKILKKKAKFWLRICCDTPVTARPVETRMGKGKGPISYWAAKVYPGQIFFEFNGLTKVIAYHILQNLSKKSPIPLKLISYSHDLSPIRKERKGTALVN